MDAEHFALPTFSPRYESRVFASSEASSFSCEKEDNWLTSLWVVSEVMLVVYRWKTLVGQKEMKAWVQS